MHGDIARAIAIMEEAGSFESAGTYARGLVYKAKGTITGVLPRTLHRDVYEQILDHTVDRTK